MKLILSTTLLIFITSILYSETVYLKNGETIKGKIIKTEVKSIIIETSFGKVTIDKDKIQRIDFDEKSTIKKEEKVIQRIEQPEKYKVLLNDSIYMKDGSTVTGEIFKSDDNVISIKTTSGIKVINKKDIIKVKFDTSQVTSSKIISEGEIKEGKAKKLTPYSSGWNRIIQKDSKFILNYYHISGFGMEGMEDFKIKPFAFYAEYIWPRDVKDLKEGQFEFYSINNFYMNIGIDSPYSKQSLIINILSFGVIGGKSGTKKDIAREIIKFGPEVEVRENVSLLYLGLGGLGGILGGSLETKVEGSYPLTQHLHIAGFLSVSMSSMFVEGSETTWGYGYGGDVYLIPFSSFPNFKISGGALYQMIASTSKIKIYTIGITYEWGSDYQGLSIGGEVK